MYADLRGPWNQQFGRFWDLFLVGVCALGALDFARHDGGLLSRRGAWVVALMIALFAAHRWLWTHPDWVEGRWPLPQRVVLVCILIELLLVLGLLEESAYFSAVLVALAGQIGAALPPRRWLWPMAPVMLVLIRQVGLVDALLAESWGLAIGLAAALAWLVLLFLFIQLQFDARYERQILAAGLRQAADELDRVAPQLAALQSARQRARDADALRDTIADTMAVIRIRLETVRTLLTSDAATARADLIAVEALLARNIAKIRAMPQLAELPETPDETTETPPALDEMNEMTETTETPPAAPETA